jgi:hypothetical protein
MLPERNPDQEYVQTRTCPVKRSGVNPIGKKHLADAVPPSIEERHEWQSFLGLLPALCERGRPGASSALPGGGVAVAGEVAHQPERLVEGKRSGVSGLESGV